MNEALLQQELNMKTGNADSSRLISKDRLGVYQLLTGDLSYLERRFALDWRRALGVYMWCESLIF